MLPKVADRPDSLHTPHSLHTEDARDAQDCPIGFLWYSCQVNTFEGCCSIDPCFVGITCPLINQPLRPATTSPSSSTSSTSFTTVSSATPPSNTISPEVMASSMSSWSAIPSTSTQTVIVSVGPPLGTSMNSMTSAASLTAPSASPSQSALITTLATSQTITVVVPQSSNSAQSSIPSASTSINNGISTNSQSFPIGLIAGIVTGFSILMLVMGLMFAILWRNKKIKFIGDSEATRMRGQRSAVRAYYMPPPPHKKIESAETTPVRAKFPPEVMTPRRNSGGGGGDVNKPWPPMPPAAPAAPAEGAMRTSASPFRAGYSVGGMYTQTHSMTASLNIVPCPLLLNFSFTGRIIKYPDPLRANGLVSPGIETHTAVPFTPSKAAVLQHQQPSSSPSPREGPSHLSTQEEVSPSSTDSGNGPTAAAAALKDGSSTPSREQTISHHRQRDSGLTRADSTAQSHFSLRPPPRRRPQSSSSETATSTDEGRLSRTPGLRLSGVSQGTVRPADDGAEGQKESVEDECEAEPTPHRATWYGEGKGRDWSSSATPPRSGWRRYSQ